MKKNETPTRSTRTTSRHEKVRASFNKFSAVRIKGMKFDYDSIIQKVADENDYSTETVKRILKTE